MSNLNAPNADRWLEIVEAQVSGLKFGVVQIVVHESKVVQIEKTEKVRLTEGSAGAASARKFPNQSSGGFIER